MVYGQTGTGKTFTVQAEDGLIPTTISQLFKTVNEDKEYEYSVFLSYLQIYHERIYDLLDSSNETDLHLREHPDEGVIVEGLSEFEITSTNVANSLLEYGRKQLVVAETKLVRVSSRSHSMCILKVQKRKKRSEMTEDQDCITVEESFLKGRLYLCDLAGSERLKKSGITGERQREAKYINSSLLELGNVIHALSVAKSHHIPFRNSTLTRILKESLGGNSKASLMICISSSLRHTSETKCSLNFGQRALRVTKSSSPNIEHFVHPYTVTKPRFSSSTLYPKIDYKALSEYLTKKLKELENAYQFEKQTYKRMQEELRNARKGQSKIPVLTRRSRKPTPRDEEARVLKETCLAEEIKSSEMSKKDTKKAKEDFQQKPRNVEEAEMDFSSDKLGDPASKVDYFDETDLGTPRTDIGDFRNQESSKSNRSKDELMLDGKDVASISCQTDENANYIITSSEPKMDVEGLASNKKEVDTLPVSEKIIKMTQNSFCQTDTSYEWSCKGEERKDQESFKERTYRKDTPEMESKATDIIITEDSIEKAKLDPGMELIEVEKASKDKGFDGGKEESNEGQWKMLKLEIHASGDKHEKERGEDDKIVEDITHGEMISMEIADVVQLQQQNPERMFDMDAASPIEDKDFLHRSWETDIANSDETSAVNREQKYNIEGMQALTADETLDKDIVLDSIQNENDANSHLNIGRRSRELKEVHSVRDMGFIEEEEIVKDELNYFEESAPHEMYDVKVKGHFESEGRKNSNIREFVLSTALSQSESVRGENDVRSISSDANLVEEEIKETESHNAKFGDSDLKELLLSSNEKLDFEDCNFESKTKNSSKDRNSDEKVSASPEIATAKKGDIQTIEEKESTMKDNNNNELLLREKEKKGINDVGGNLLQPENALLAMEVKEKEDFYEGPSKEIEKKLNKTRATTNKVGGEKQSDIIGYQESQNVGCLVVKDYESKTNLDRMSEIIKQENELGVGETTKARNLIELSNLSNAPCLENEEQTVKSNRSKDVDTESVAWQTSSSQSEVVDLEVKTREVYGPSEKEGGACEIAHQEIYESTGIVNEESQEELDGNNLIKCEGDNEDSHKTTYSIENEPCFADTIKIDISKKESQDKVSENHITAVTVRDNEKQRFSDIIMDDGEVQNLIGDETSSIETEMKKALTSKEGHLLKESMENEYEVIECLIPGDGAESKSIREAVIIKNREKERNERPLSIGEARIISPKHQKQVHFKKTEDGETSGEAIEKEAAMGGDSVDRKAMDILLPSQHLTFDMTNTPFFDSSVDGDSCSPSGASAESEFSLALKEKDKLQKALTTVKHQYEDLLKEFDKIIESNTKENNNNENVPISKENYNIALKCKEELEMEIRKAREQLAIVQAAHDSISEELTWHSSEYEFSEDSESVSFDFDESREESRWTSTPLPYDTSLSNAAPKYPNRKNNSVQNDNESINDYKDTEERKPVLQERGTNTSPESEAGTTTIGYGTHDLSAVKFSELQRLPATLPRRRGSKRRSRTLQLDEQSDGKWVSRKSLVDKEQAKKNEKLTLQAIENAELKKELLLTKLEKIRLEAMLSCVMMRVSNSDVEDGFKKISLNSITSSTSTLRSTTSLTNIAQNDPSSPFQAHSPFRKSHGRRVTSPIGEEQKSSQHRVRFDESRKTPSSTSPRSSSLFGHLSLLTQSSLSPSSLDIEISSYVSSDVSTPVPNERISPCGQDGDVSFQSPSSNQSKPGDTERKEHDINIGYRGKSKLRLAACLPFRKKKKSSKDSRTNRDDKFEDSYGANC